MKISEVNYLVLEPTYRSPFPDSNGVRPVSEFRVAGIRKNRPGAKAGAVVIRINLQVDSSIFETLVPAVTVDINDRFVVPSVEIEPVEDESLD